MGYRKAIFEKNRIWVMIENSRNLSYTVGTNCMADWTREEYRQVLGYAPTLRIPGLKSSPWKALAKSMPHAVDWVTKGGVNPVKNQAQCGSCWAFSATAAVEGAYFVSSGNLLSLSEQQLVSCDETDNGCGGGLMDNAFTYLESHGQCLESAYPYTSGSGSRGSCRDSCTPHVRVTSFTDVPSREEDSLRSAVAQQVVSVAIEADQYAFQMYTGGVLDSESCGTNLDHGVAVVGYGTDGGKDYWKVRNSWGSTWGEEGYIRMVRGKNMCGISQQPSYPNAVAAQSQAVLGTDLAVSWSDCGDANTIAKITSFTPGTVTLGKEETLTGTGSVSQDVSGGSFSINLKAGILIHETFTGDICKGKSFHLPLNTGTVSWEGMTCPQAKGNAAVSMKIQLAVALPASLAAAVIEAKAKTTGGGDLLCMEVKTTPAFTQV